MKAITHEKYGPPAVLEIKEIPTPTPGDDELLIEIHAAAVNSGDWRTVQGEPFLLRLAVGVFRPKKLMIGADMAGRVIEVGKNVTQFKVGDEVFGDLSGQKYGAFAEFVTVPEDAVWHKPKNLSFQQAAAIPETGAVAYHSLVEKGQIKSDDKVLIVGASGGIGTFAVQISKAFGAEVTAVCSTRNIELVSSIGADYVIDYTEKDFPAVDGQWDLIVATAGFHTPEEFRNALTSTGICVIAGGDLKQLSQMMLKGKRLSEKGGRTLTYLSHHPVQSEIIRLAEMAERGKIKPVIDRIFPFEQTADAIAYYGKGKSRGKVVIEIRSEA